MRFKMFVSFLAMVAFTSIAFQNCGGLQSASQEGSQTVRAHAAARPDLADFDGGIDHQRACSLAGKAVPSGSSIVAYKTQTVPDGQSCQKETRTCNDGKLSGSYEFPSCAPVPIVSGGCTPGAVYSFARVTAVEGSLYGVFYGSGMISDNMFGLYQTLLIDSVAKDGSFVARASYLRAWVENGYRATGSCKDGKIEFTVKYKNHSGVAKTLSATGRYGIVGIKYRWLLGGKPVSKNIFDGNGMILDKVVFGPDSKPLEPFSSLGLSDVIGY